MLFSIFMPLHSCIICWQKNIVCLCNKLLKLETVLEYTSMIPIEVIVITIKHLDSVIIGLYRHIS